MSKLFLLSEKEYIKNKDYIQSESYWWLRSYHDTDSDNCVRYVNPDRYVYNYYVFSNGLGVRPAFKFKIDPYVGVKPGSIIHCGKLDWIKLKDGIYLSKDIVFNYHFDKKSNDYNASDIKKKLEEYESLWFTKIKLRILKDFEEIE